MHLILFSLLSHIMIVERTNMQNTAYNKKIGPFWLCLGVMLSLMLINSLSFADSRVMNVTVPTSMGLYVAADGVVTAATNATIINNSTDDIEITAVQVIMQNDWVLVPFNKDFSGVYAGTHEIGFRLNTEIVDAYGLIPLSSDNWANIDNSGGTLTVQYEAKLPVQSEAYTDAVASIVFVFGWVNDYVPPVDKQYLYAEVGSATTTNTTYTSGYRIGQYSRVAHAALASAIPTAQNELNNPASTQATVDSALAALQSKHSDFKDYPLVTELWITPPDNNFTRSGSALTGYTGDAPFVIVPSVVGGVTITNLSSTFKSNTVVEKVRLPNTVTTMLTTFQYATALQFVENIPTGVTNLANVFQGCTALTSAPELPSQVTNLNSTFQGCTALVTGPPLIGHAVTTLNSVFQGCINLSGTIQINANLANKGSSLKSAFDNAATNFTASLVITGTSPQLSSIIATKSKTSNINN